MHNHQPEQPVSLADPHALGLAALLTLQLRHVQCRSQAAQPQAKCSSNSTGTALAVQPWHHHGLWLGTLPVQSAELSGHGTLAAGMNWKRTLKDRQKCWCSGKRRLAHYLQSVLGQGGLKVTRRTKISAFRLRCFFPHIALSPLTFPHF